ncbi:hypothetical protein [Janthinobacterium sp. Ant5-2-1]|uniref:hypothetical protein n=1 Tax=Janthinobacterium sp. Ant5-2-1 TaxID=1755239 RepID=UPI000718169E|nr:hypothetical protein [Janthinobacterium sp. Ant5-2-1]
MLKPVNVRHAFTCLLLAEYTSFASAAIKQELEQFARDNRCTLTDYIGFAHELREVAIKNKGPKAYYASLICHERDTS